MLTLSCEARSIVLCVSAGPSGEGAPLATADALLYDSDFAAGSDGWELVLRAGLVGDVSLTALTVPLSPISSATTSKNDQVEPDESGLRVLPKSGMDVREFSIQVRTALNGLLGARQAIRDDQLHPEQKLYVDVMRWSADILAETLLQSPPKPSTVFETDLSRDEEGIIHLGDFTRELRSLSSSLAREKRIDLSWRQIDAQFVASPVGLREVMTSLALNAVTHTRKGSVRVDISRQRTVAGDQLVFEVVDTGPGISAALPPIETTCRATGKEARPPEFSATCRTIGYCRELIESCGGTLEISSPAHGGTLAVAQFDVVFADHHFDGAPIRIDAQPRRLEMPGISILVADDSKTNRHVMQAFLELNGAEADYACDGTEALSALDGHWYDLLLLDIDMPGASGEEVARRVRMLESDNNLARPLIYAVTARCSIEDWARYERLGFDGMISKPVSNKQLQRALRTACRLRFFPNEMLKGARRSGPETSTDLVPISAIS